MGKSFNLGDLGRGGLNFDKLDQPSSSKLQNKERIHSTGRVYGNLNAGKLRRHIETVSKYVDRSKKIDEPNIFQKIKSRMKKMKGNPMLKRKGLQKKIQRLYQIMIEPELIKNKQLMYSKIDYIFESFVEDNHPEYTKKVLYFNDYKFMIKIMEDFSNLDQLEPLDHYMQAYLFQKVSDLLKNNVNANLQMVDIMNENKSSKDRDTIKHLNDVNLILKEQIERLDKDYEIEKQKSEVYEQESKQFKCNFLDCIERQRRKMSL